MNAFLGLREAKRSDRVLDLAIRDEASSVRNRHAADLLAGSRHVALDLLRRESTAKVGIVVERPIAARVNT